MSIDIAGKKVLLAVHDIANYAGAELHCLQLACTFKEKGAYVEVATLNYAFPVRAEYEKNNISVKNVFFDPLDFSEYDLIWLHHTIIADYILFQMEVRAPKIIYDSLSPFEPLDAVPAYGKYLSCCLANSEETRQAMIEEGVPADNILVFPNFVTTEMLNSARKRENRTIRKIAVVSNHIPQEVHDAIWELKQRNILVDIYGLGYHVSLVDSELLQNYDAVVSIGKTVQYCMALYIPVYCYDIHGGPGWIDENDIKKAFALNFSGRGFSRKSGIEIANEIMCLPDNTDFLRKFVEENCILETNLSKLLESIHDVDEENLSSYAASCSRINKTAISLFRSSLYLEMQLIEEKKKMEGLKMERKNMQERSEEFYSSIDKKLDTILSEYSECVQSSYKQLQRADEELMKIKEEKKRYLSELEKILQCKYLPVANLNSADTKEADDVLVRIHQIQGIVEQQIEALNQKEANCRYLIELLEEKDKRIEQLEQEKQVAHDGLQKKMNDLQIVVDRQEAELNQKEANCRYLIELGAEKDKTICEIYSSRAWQILSLIRRAKNKAKRIVKKIFRLGKEKTVAPEVPIQKVVEENQVEEKKQFPLVTVGIPVYDRTDFLIQSIESILNQTYPNIEIIAVCDGSPPDTLEIVKRYERKNKIRAFYYKDNSGNAVRGRNKAIREAKGEFFAFQDSDDIATPKRIELSVACMNEYGADVVYGGWKALVDGTRIIDIKNGQEVFSPDCDIEMLKKICVPCQSTVMVRTAALRHVGGLKTEMKYREDHELWLRLAYFGYRFKSIQEILTNLRLHENNLELSFQDTDDKWFQLMQSEYKKVFPMKPKVAYLIPGCGISGGIAVICQHLNRLKKRGYDVLMITETDTTEIPWFPNQNVAIVTVDNAPDNIDYLVATGWSTAYSIQKIPAKKKCYFVQSDETRFNPEGSREYNLAFESYKMDLIYITEAKWIKQWLREKFGQNAFYVPNGLDTDIIYSTTPRDTDPNRKVRVLLEGPIDIPYKGMHYAFAAVEGLDCEVWCISSAGVPKPNWRCDRFFSRVPMDQMKYIYSSCDILLKMSQVEGFFGPPMEMMACHGACVVGKVTGYDEYIVDNYNALVVEPGDVEGAHNALKKLIEDKELRERLAENGYNTAMKWKWDESIDLLEQIFQPIT